MIKNMHKGHLSVYMLDINTNSYQNDINEREKV